jgi:hypothetical protein
VTHINCHVILLLESIYFALASRVYVYIILCLCPCESMRVCLLYYMCEFATVCLRVLCMCTMCTHVHVNKSEAGYQDDVIFIFLRSASGHPVWSGG